MSRNQDGSSVKEVIESDLPEMKNLTLSPVVRDPIPFDRDGRNVNSPPQRSHNAKREQHEKDFAEYNALLDSRANALLQKYGIRKIVDVLDDRGRALLEAEEMITELHKRLEEVEKKHGIVLDGEKEAVMKIKGKVAWGKSDSTRTKPSQSRNK